MNQEMAEKFRSAQGFIAALDQSGGSTPKALKLYGIEESEYSGDDQMFDLVHQMRTRIIKNSAFHGDRVLAAICSKARWIATSTVSGPPSTCGIPRTSFRSSR